jgi:D-alanine transaminase
VTRHADHAILGGITRSVLFDAVKGQGLTVEQRPFALDEAYAAREAFITSATQTVMPVVRIDGRLIGDGKPGPIATTLRREFHRFAETA